MIYTFFKSIKLLSVLLFFLGFFWEAAAQETSGTRANENIYSLAVEVDDVVFVGNSSKCEYRIRGSVRGQNLQYAGIFRGGNGLVGIPVRVERRRLGQYPFDVTVIMPWDGISVRVGDIRGYFVERQINVRQCNDPCSK